MNYIRHFNAAWQKLATNQQVTPHHISLYVTLFQLWNQKRFNNPLPISREEVMQLSKIGSVNTYIRCLKQLHEWKFLDYQPSFNSVVGSRVTLFTFDNAESNAESNAEPVYTLYNNINNTNINKRVNGTLAPTFLEVEIYFKEINAIEEAEKFFSHYQANGWLQAGKTPIQDWKAAAQSWLTKREQFTSGIIKSDNAESNAQHGNTQTSTHKDYSEPL